MRNPEEIIRALLAKTVANGCTEGEAAAAKAKAEELAVKYGVNLDTVNDKAADDFAEVFKRAKARAKAKAEAAYAKAEAEAKARAKEKASTKPKTFNFVGDLVKYLLVMFPNATFESIAEVTRKYFPSANTSASTVSWYASDLRRSGVEVASKKSRTKVFDMVETKE